MAQEKQMQFDKNKFTMDMLNCKGTFLSSFEKSFTRVLDLAPTRDSYDWIPTTEKELNDAIRMHSNDKDTAAIDLLKAQYECYTNPNGDFARILRQYWAFAKYIFMEYEERNFNYYQLIVNKIDIFDEQTQLAVLNRLYSILSFSSSEKKPQILSQIEIKIANNKFATIDDKYKAAYYMSNKNHDIVRDVIEDFKQELNKELTADFPDPEKIKQIWLYAKTVIDQAREGMYDSKVVNPVDRAYIDAVKDEFDLKKILAGGTEYVAKTKETLEERANAAEKQLKVKDEEIHKMEKDIYYLDTSAKETQSKLQTEKDKNAQLIKIMNEMQQQIDQKDAFIKAVKMKMASLKMGVFGNGKEFQAWLTQELDKQIQK